MPLGRPNCFHSAMKPFLVEDLDAVVLAVADEQAALRIEGQGVRAVEFADARALFAPGFEELTVGVELHDARIGGRLLSVAVGHKNVAVRSNSDFGGLVEGIQ